MMIPVNEIKQREDISIMSFIRKNGAGILLCLAIAIPSWIIGQCFPVVGEMADLLSQGDVTITISTEDNV